MQINWSGALDQVFISLYNDNLTHSNSVRNAEVDMINYSKSRLSSYKAMKD